MFEMRKGRVRNFKEEKGEGRVWFGEIRGFSDDLKPKLAIVYSFNLKSLKPASNLLKLQNIFSFTTPSYFKLFIS